MRILHFEAINDDHYCQHFYSPFHHIMNWGGYILVTKMYFEFGAALIRCICSLVTVDALIEQKQGFLKYVKNDIIHDDNLFSSFSRMDVDSEASTTTLNNDNIKRDIFIKIAVAMTNERKCGAIMKQHQEQFLWRSRRDMMLKVKLMMSVADATMEKARSIQQEVISK